MEATVAKFALSFADRPTTLSLSQKQEKLLPTIEDVRFFQEHGWFITPKILSDSLIDRIYRASEEIYEGKKDAELPAAGCSNWQVGDRVAVRNNEYISFQKQAFQELSLQPIIGAIAARLMGTDSVRYFQDQLVSKEPARTDATHVGWHTDRSYHSNCTSDKILTAWIPLHDVNEEHGPLVMVDCSHTWSGTDHMRGFNHDNHKLVEQSFIQKGKKFNKIPIVLQKGQISFHCSSLVHGSYQNRSNIMRRAVVLNIQDAENCYQEFWNNGKQIHHYLDSLCRKQANGLPDYADPDIFPVIWSK